MEFASRPHTPDKHCQDNYLEYVNVVTVDITNIHPLNPVVKSEFLPHIILKENRHRTRILFKEA